MVKHTIFIDDSNLDFIDLESDEIDIASNIITNFDKPYRLQIGDKFNGFHSLIMYEDICSERAIEEMMELLKKYNKKYNGLYVSGFLIDDPNEDSLFTFVRINFI